VTICFPLVRTSVGRKIGYDYQCGLKLICRTIIEKWLATDEERFFGLVFNEVIFPTSGLIFFIEVIFPTSRYFLKRFVSFGLVFNEVIFPTSGLIFNEVIFPTSVFFQGLLLIK
jgi:hypothetical protein